MMDLTMNFDTECLIKETEMTQWKQSTISFHF